MNTPPPMPTPPRQGVVIACRRPDGRWLMVRRSRSVSRAPLKIGFPGGEIEPGESQPHAVIREAREEVGLRVQPLRCVWQYDWSGAGHSAVIPESWRLWGWAADMLTHTPRPRPAEIAEILWLTTAEAARHPDALPTTGHFLQHLDPPHP